MDTLNTPIGDIARDQPSSTRVFLRHKLDFCCGGRRTLREACEKAGLDADKVIAELSEAAATTPAENWQERSSAQLVSHIVARYHETLRRDIPMLIDAARKVERVHADKPAVPAGLAEELVEFWTEMQQHMMKEERVLFPMLATGVHGTQVYMPVRVMEHEHDEQSVHLARIRELTGDLQIPPHACATWRALYSGLEVIEAELMEHIHLENNVLFPRASGTV
ncbi:MAG TPA: iron-sulfur cluster repair protein YtfE [Kofleriaceae bacterium]